MLFNDDTIKQSLPHTPTKMKPLITYKKEVSGQPVAMHARPVGDVCGNGEKPIILWAHGWGRGGDDFIPLAMALTGLADHYVLTLPGFGDTPIPPDDWGSSAYADFIAGFINDEINPDRPVIWIGHSFGAKLGIYLAARTDVLFNRLILMACPGLPHQKPFFERLALWAKIYTFKGLKTIFPFAEDRLINYFGSRDYRAAGPLRSVLTRVVGETVTPLLNQINMPVHLIYGAQDTATPPAIGHEMVKHLPDGKMTVFDHLDHISLITNGRQICLMNIKREIQKLNLDRM